MNVVRFCVADAEPSCSGICTFLREAKQLSENNITLNSDDREKNPDFVNVPRSIADSGGSTAAAVPEGRLKTLLSTLCCAKL